MAIPISEYYRTRDVLVDFLRRDCIGPVEEQEVLSESPLDAYACGILWPKHVQVAQPEMIEIAPPPEEICAVPDESGIEELDEADHTDLLDANLYKPSVMAMSFAIPAGQDTITVYFSAARYTQTAKQRENKSYVDHFFTRHPLFSGKLTMNVSHPQTVELFEGRARLRLFCRKTMPDGSMLLTLSAENTQVSQAKQLEQSIRALFQCCLRIEGAFLPIDRSDFAGNDEDRALQELLYRDCRTYAIGHGCSVLWPEDGPVDQLESSFLPTAVVRQMTAGITKDDRCMEMYRWGEPWRKEGLQELASFVDAYDAWRKQLCERASQLRSSMKPAAERVLSYIGECIGRLHEGIHVLATNNLAWKAFLFTNEAMLQQAAKRLKLPQNAVRWYPFQLCYLLMCIPDMVNEASLYRKTVDLLWFPTGGGKTEAYLAVAAFTIFFRRMTQPQRGGGVTVLMRYTLRMLTAQQYERASALICACELIRRREQLPGGEISIGLWVGGGVTPNHVDNGSEEDAQSILEKLRQHPNETVGVSPVQLRICPHCGAALTPADAYEVAQHALITHCPDPECPFHDALPVMTVDDDIYRRRPSLLIGTIDKFARLTWDAKTGAVFGTDGQNLPPSLIIQDELHLISGPLGSVSGLYELAIDALCSRDGHTAKILASTATVCNAQAQVRALYRREVFQFPPSGLDSGDSFFARMADPTDKPERLYVGLCETGGSLVDALVRTFGTMTFALQYMAHIGIADEAIDQYWTNMGYFNALKELGSADTVILDRVMAYAESLRRGKFCREAEKAGMTAVERTYEHDELTSRKKADEITQIRTKLDLFQYPDSKAYAYILSSNMLSVGIDIKRLGLMTVYGQPKSTAEYIQATSRVGRSHPGLVIVLLRMMRARDKSHFEQFQAYHQTLNRLVEPATVTPFSPCALDKALHAVFVIMVRHLIPQLSANDHAHLFRADQPEVQHIRDRIMAAVRVCAPGSVADAADILNDFMAEWEQLAKMKGPAFRYAATDGRTNDKDALLVPAEQYTRQALPPTLNSMRDVDTGSGIYLVKRGDR